jgi:DNA modification methylase
MSVTILTGDCRERLAELADGSVNCIVTSPPYYGLRDYGNASQLGLEETPEDYVAEMVAVFREARRVLRDDGTLWLNIGDSYSTHAAGKVSNPMAKSTLAGVKTQEVANSSSRAQGKYRKDASLPEKNLIGVPWRLAFALQADGWILRQDIIWHKPNPMPESVRDRCTKAHEYVFLLSKSSRYLFDSEAIAEKAADSSMARWAQDGLADQQGSDRVPGKTNGPMKAVGGAARPQAQRAVELAREHGLTEEHIAAIRSVGITDVGKARVTQDGAGKNDPKVQALADEAKAILGGYYREFLISDLRNKRSVWSIATMPFKEAHFATMAPELARTCIMAGCPLGGTVLDPFGGAGTTGLVADQLQRNAVLIELNPEYVEIARKRINADAGMFATEAA